MKVVGVIQARLGSTRLPEKVFFQLGDSTVLDYVYKRTKNISNIKQVVVATTKNSIDDPIELWCKKNEIEVFRGSEQDLLERFLKCALHYNADYIVRITGDCPFFSYEMANNLIETTIENNSEYGFIDSKLIPIGLKVSIIKTETLRLLNIIAKHPFYREHITLYIDEHIEDFKISKIQPESIFLNKNYRLTIDTREDYQFCNKIAQQIQAHPLIETKMIIDFLDNNRDLLKLNAAIKQNVYRVKNMN